VKRVHLQHLYKTDRKPFTPQPEQSYPCTCVKDMSKIFEALRRAESLRAKQKESKTVGACNVGFTDRRTTSRIYVRIPLFIYGYAPDGDPFYEETYSIVVNGAGGLISTTSDVRPGQRLVVTNEGNDQTQECVVVSVEP